MKLKSLIAQTTLVAGIIAAQSAITGAIALPVSAQQQQRPNVSVVHLQVQPGQNGQQMVLTPRGFLVPLPGQGVNGNVIDVYMGNNGGYWYTDRTGQTEDLTPYVQKLQAKMASMGQAQATPPQYAPYGNTTVNNYNGNGNGTSSGSSAMGTAAAAGLGAMAGSAMSGLFYNNVPYGTPMYYGAHPYYVGADGRNVFVNGDGDVNWNHVAAANNVHNNQQQQKMDEAAQFQNQNQAQRAANMNANQAQRQNAYAQANQPRFGQQQEHFQQQSDWYQKQMAGNGAQAKAWQESAGGANPFVRDNAAADRSGERAGRFGGAADGAADRAGRFGGAADGAANRAGRFGNAGGAGRFGGGGLGRRGR